MGFKNFFTPGEEGNWMGDAKVESSLHDRQAEIRVFAEACVAFGITTFRFLFDFSF